MRRVDAYASAIHYLQHILPIWKKLPNRGTLYVTSRLVEYCNGLGLSVAQSRPKRTTDPIIVASYPDYQLTAPRPVVFVEHGAGQRYLDAPKHPAYSGGSDRDRTICFICPSRAVAEANRALYPNTPAIVAGCPKLDAWHPAPPKPLSDPPVVAMAWHADLRLVPETSSGFKFFASMIPTLRHLGYTLLGHGHPRIINHIERVYRRYEVPIVRSLDDVFAQADVMTVDNSSAGFEFASLNRPVVWLSPPAYRRDVDHGLRFWDATRIWPHASDPTEVPAAIEQALALPSNKIRAARDSFINSVYNYRDGLAAERAADAIMEALMEVPA